MIRSEIRREWSQPSSRGAPERRKGGAEESGHIVQPIASNHVHRGCIQHVEQPPCTIGDDDIALILHPAQMHPALQARGGSLGSEIGSQAVIFDGDRRLAARRCPRWVCGGLGWYERGCRPHPARPGHSRRPSRRPSIQGSSSRGARHRLDVMHRIQVAQDGANVAGWCHHRRRGQSRRV